MKWVTLASPSDMKYSPEACKAQPAFKLSRLEGVLDIVHQEACIENGALELRRAWPPLDPCVDAERRQKAIAESGIDYSYDGLAQALPKKAKRTVFASDDA